MKDYKVWFNAIELVSSCIFLVEYFLRLKVCIENPLYSRLGGCHGRLKYIRSWTAIIDAVATFPFFVDLASVRPDLLYAPARPHTFLAHAIYCVN